MGKREQENFMGIMGGLLNKDKALKKPAYHNPYLKAKEVDEKTNYELDVEEVTYEENGKADVDVELNRLAEALSDNVSDMMEETDTSVTEENTTVDEENTENSLLQDLLEDNEDDDDSIIDLGEDTEKTDEEVENKEDKEMVTAIIPAGACVNGNLIFTSNLMVNGEITGDVECSETIFLGEGAKIKGNIKAKSIFINNSEVTGDLDIENIVECGGSSVIDGNIKAETVKLDSKIIGNIVAKESVELKEASNVKGNITTKIMSTVYGAVICGIMEVGVLDEEKN